ncbi:MAG TPA: biotin-independent malonate decarboxylase subunit gamma [Steroidobacteraceae bacterium]|jgi:malonate decarboxylase gamma subunit|nr:biotin-independent malonate decarboxylase subunit gamma [Steroidobacteraceae bacterium]
MKLGDILHSLFPAGCNLGAEGKLLAGHGSLPGGGAIHVLGVTEGTFLGVDEALWLARRVLEIGRAREATPILLLVDSASQRMSRRDELLGLNEYLAHLAKALIVAEIAGHGSVGLLYGHSAAGAFIATGLATRALVALPGATPTVMDLPSMARVTKLSVDFLREKAARTPVFAPGLDNLAQAGAVLEIWDPGKPLDLQLASCLSKLPAADARDRLGQERGGRPKAATIAARVAKSAF